MTDRDSFLRRPRNRGKINSLLLGSLSLFCATAVLPQTARAGQPMGPTADLPGISKGKVEAYWIGPNVRVSKARIGERGATTVTWFNEDGTIKRQADVSITEPGFVTTITHPLPEALTRSRFAPDFVRQYAYRNVVQGVNADWKIVLPIKTGPAGYTTSTRDSRVFLHEFHPKQGQIALDIYVHGKLANTVGPFPQYGGQDVHLSDDGSAALLVWKDETEKTAQLVVLNPDGKVSFRVDCDNPVHSPIPSPDGAGALLRPNTGGTNQNTFMWYTRVGKLRLLDISPNPYCVGWVPDSRKSLFSTSGFDHRYRLIDWNAAKTLWDIPCPGDKGHALAIGLTPRLVIFAVGELHQPGPWSGTQWVLREGQKEWIRAFYAFSVEDGSLVARWQAPYPRRISTEDRASFLWLGDRLFFLTSDEVVEFSEEEIISKKNGWK